VADYALPNKDNYLTEVDMIQSPDTLALSTTCRCGARGTGR